MDINKIKKEIDTSHQVIYKVMNLECRKILFLIGKCLSERIFQIDSLYERLYSLYGNTIIFSKRSLHYSQLFYEKYHKVIGKVPFNMTWNQIVILLENHYSLKEDVEIFETINFFSLDEAEISHYLTTGKIIFFNSKKMLNNILYEFMNLQEMEE